jgi:predicted hydrocarbon binding protein
MEANMSDINLNYKDKPSLFTWDGLGDIQEGRSNLGDDMPVLIYRLFQYSLRDILRREFNDGIAAELYRAAGYLAGTEFARHVLDLSGDFDYFVTNLQKQLTNLKMGILRIEKADIANATFTLTMSEDLDCSGLPVTDETVCDYDEGFIAGILEAYTGRPFAVKEIDCWASGDRTCRFTAKGE